MIRREAGSDFFLIAQNDHAILAGQLAQHFGNDRFAQPEPRESVLTGVSMHDAGWPLHDDEPTLNADHRPLDVFETPRPIGLKVWAASAERAAAVDPYAGLLVSLHSLALSIFATSASTPGRHEKFDVSQLSERFEVNKFQHREVERQEQLRRQLGLRTDLPLTHGLAEPHASPQDDRLAFHFRMLQAMDLISLCCCCTHPPAEKTQDVFTKPGATATHLKLRRDKQENAIRVDPWPFDQVRIGLTVPFRRVRARAYVDSADLQQHLAAAATEHLSVSVVQ
jgi:hypothetical protein